MRILMTASLWAQQTKDNTKSLLQEDIASELDLSERTNSPVEEKSQARIDKYSCPEKGGGTSFAASKPINLEKTACACLRTRFEITENSECFNSLAGGNNESNKPCVATAAIRQSSRQRANHISNRCHHLAIAVLPWYQQHSAPGDEETSQQGLCRIV